VTQGEKELGEWGSTSMPVAVGSEEVWTCSWCDMLASQGVEWHSRENGMCRSLTDRKGPQPRWDEEVEY